MERNSSEAPDRSRLLERLPEHRVGATTQDASRIGGRRAATPAHETSQPAPSLTSLSHSSEVIKLFRNGRRRSVPLVAMVAAGALLAACATGSGTDGKGPSGKAPSDKALTIGIIGGVPNLDPINANNLTVDESVRPVYDNLVDFDSSGELTGRLATKWTTSPDGKSINFTLRDDAKFHDGAPVTSDDVAFTLDRIKALGIGVASKLTQYESTTVSDPTHFTIRLSSPSSIFLGALNRVYVLNSKLVKSHLGTDNAQGWLASAGAGSGPYTLEEYTANSQIVYRTNPDYVGNANPKRAQVVVYRLLDSNATAQNQLLSGAIQVATGVPLAQLAQFQGNSKFEVALIPDRLLTVIYFNTQKGLTANPEIRRAIRLAYDYDAHTESILRGHANVASGILTPQTDCRADLATAKQNLDESKALFAKAGASDATLTLSFQPGIAELASGAELLQSSLAKIGVTLKLVPNAFPAYLQMLASPATTPDLAISWFSQPDPNPGSTLNPQFNSKYVGTGSNFSQFSNPEVDKLLSEAVASSDPDLQCANFKKVQEIVDEQAVVLPIAYQQRVYISTPNVTGVDITHPGHDGQFHPAHYGFN